MALARRILLCGLLCWRAAAAGTAAPPAVTLPSTAFTARDLAVIVNDADPLSVAIGDYYRQRRAIPAENVIHVSFEPTRTSLAVPEFAALRRDVLTRTPQHVQAYALTWVRPYRVDCMSITTAFAAGFEPAFCSERCTATRWSPYFNSNSRRPFDQFGLRPTMSIAALDLDSARALIDRGIAASGSPAGTAYLIETEDLLRNVRAAAYPDAKLLAGNAIPIEVVRAAALESKQDVMFYFIGAAEVAKLGSNRFLPGAVADHLTSLGGDLTGSLQMSSLRWLEAGATGSYGTVTEPCNILSKFPNPGMLMKRYLAGESLIEAYWKSVAMPGQGLFIGEPLANPFGGYRVAYDGRDLWIEARALAPGRYEITASNDTAGPYVAVARDVNVAQRGASLTIRDAAYRYYRLLPQR